MSGDLLLVSSRSSPQRSRAAILDVLRPDLDRFAPALADDITAPVLPALLDSSTTSAQVSDRGLIQEQSHDDHDHGSASDVETQLMLLSDQLRVEPELFLRLERSASVDRLALSGHLSYLRELGK